MVMQVPDLPVFFFILTACLFLQCSVSELSSLTSRQAAALTEHLRAVSLRPSGRLSRTLVFRLFCRSSPAESSCGFTAPRGNR